MAEIMRFTDGNVVVNSGGGGGSTPPPFTILDVYPVGSIYMSVNNVNPATLFGGTWVTWGAGRVPVGVSSSGTFNTVEKTGGAETVTAGGSVGGHTLTVAEIPAHGHKINKRQQWYAADTEVAGTSDGSIYSWKTTTGGATSKAYQNSSNDITNTGGGGSHNHGFTGTAHNNLQPYITCYMWKRTA